MTTRQGGSIMALVMALGCDASVDRRSDNPPANAADTASGERAPRDTSAAAPGAAREIYIDSVVAGNPLIVRGRARTFENTVQVRARDSKGGIITEAFETSVGEMGNHNPFVARVFLVREPGPHTTVEAFEYSANDGSVRSLTESRVAVPPARTRLTLMFATSDCSRTAAFSREVPSSVAVARLLVEMLVAGPTDAEKAAGASAPFPRGSRVNSVVLRDGELTVDFNHALQNVGGACAAQAIRESVTQTLRRLPGVARVVITAAGSRPLALQP
jgi:hypothetical protein